MKTLLLAAALTASCFGQAPQSTKVDNPSYRALIQEVQAKVKQVDVPKLRAMRDTQPNLTLIDVRETEEWVTGRASGAIHISRGILEHEIETKAPNKQSTIVLYCRSGARSALAAESLMRMGYTNVYSLDGGFTAYKAAGLPVEK